MVWKQLTGGLRFAACALLFLLAAQRAFSQPYLLWTSCTNGQFQFTLGGWAGIPFVLESSPDMVNWTAVLTNTASSNYLPITAPATNDTRYFRTMTRQVLAPCPFVFSYALAAKTNINLNGHSLITDSYNSGDTSLSTNGQYDPLKASTNGNVASVDGMVNLGGCTINGNLYLGPAAIYDGSVTNVTGTIYSNYDLQFPDVALPATDTSSNAVVWFYAPGTTNSHDFTVSGYYWVNNSGTITVEPGVSVTLNVTAQNFNPSSITTKGGVTNSGSLVMYHNPPSPGGSATLTCNSAGGPIGNRPANFIFFGMRNDSSVTLSGTADFVGVIYAPDAVIMMNGGGIRLNVCGSIIAGQVTDNGHYILHFDESLLTADPFGYYYTYGSP